MSRKVQTENNEKYLGNIEHHFTQQTKNKEKCENIENNL